MRQKGISKMTKEVKALTAKPDGLRFISPEPTGKNCTHKNEHICTN